MSKPRALPYSRRMCIAIDDTPMTFGKYVGMTPLEIVEVDPSYICWLYDTVKPRYVTKPLYDTAQWAMYDDSEDQSTIHDIDPDLGNR